MNMDESKKMHTEEYVAKNRQKRLIQSAAYLPIKTQKKAVKAVRNKVKKVVSAKKEVKKISDMVNKPKSIIKTNTGSHILGKKTTSIIKKQPHGLRLAIGSKDTTSKATPASLMKQAVKDIAVKDFVSGNDKSGMVGKSLGQKAIYIIERIVQCSLKIAAKGVGIVIGLAAPYIIIISAIMLIIISATGGSRGISDYKVSSIYGAEDTTGGIENTKRIRVRTSLTYAEVHKIPWYSSQSPFSGDLGLDKISGDRGGNCTAYVWGRRCEIEGKRTKLGVGGNAYTWYDREKSAGVYKCGQKAKVGAVCCWSYGTKTGSPGHVAIIEKINKDGSIVVSNSAYGSTTGIPILFYITTYESESALKSAFYKFNGFIYVEKVKEEKEEKGNKESANAEGGSQKK